MRNLIFIIIIVLANNALADYDDAIDFLNKRLIKKSIQEFNNVAKNSEKTDEKANAMYNIAVIYDNGIGIEEDKNIAIAWYKKASELNHKIAQYNLGWMYYHGEIVEQNYFNALKYYNLSANQGYKKAQFNIATLYLVGLGTSKDNLKAYKWFKISSMNGIIQSNEFLVKLKSIMSNEEIKIAEKNVNLWVQTNTKTFSSSSENTSLENN